MPARHDAAGRPADPPSSPVPHPNGPTDSPSASGRRTGFRRARKALSRALTVLVVAGVAAWVVLLRPGFLGGDTTYVIVSGTSMEPALRAGDLVLARRHAAYGVGDVIVYGVRPEGATTDKLVIHRVVGGSATEGYVTRGDNRDRRDAWRPTDGDVRGALVVRVPAVGAVLSRLQQPRFLTATIAGVLVFLLVTAVAEPGRARRRRSAETVDLAVPPAPVGDTPPAPPATPGFLVLARAGDGYALVEKEGSPPGPGGLLVLDGRIFEVSGAALSPLPSDTRLCVLADRLAKLP